MAEEKEIQTDKVTEKTLEIGLWLGNDYKKNPQAFVKSLAIKARMFMMMEVYLCLVKIGMPTIENIPEDRVEEVEKGAYDWCPTPNIEEDLRKYKKCFWSIKHLV